MHVEVLCYFSLTLNLNTSTTYNIIQIVITDSELKITQRKACCRVVILEWKLLSSAEDTSTGHGDKLVYSNGITL